MNNYFHNKNNYNRKKMSNYLEFIPDDLVSVIIEHIYDFSSITSFSEFLIDIIPLERLDNIFQLLFMKKFPLVYKDVSNVINDDHYLINSELPKYALLYPLFVNRYTLKYGESVDSISSDVKEENLNTLSELGLINPGILYRAYFYKINPILYKKITKLESFDFDRFYNNLKKSRYKNGIKMNYTYYGLNWEMLYYLMKNEDLQIDGIDGSVGSFYGNLNILSQNNYMEIIEVLIESEDMKKRIIGATNINEIGEMLNIIGPHFGAENELFKFIYTEKLYRLNPSKLWEYLLESIKYNNFNMFKWLLENGETSWKNESNPNYNFYKEYNDYKIENPELGFERYDELLATF